MRVVRALLQQHRQPMIKFLGKRNTPKSIDHAPAVHPASPEHGLPESFSSYRQRAQSHGPLGGGQPQQQQQRQSSQLVTSPSATSSSEHHSGAIGGKSARQLGPLRLSKGEVWDRSDLPTRFHRLQWTQAEMDAVESGGASMFA